MYCSCYTLFSLYSYRLTVLEIAGRESKTRELYCFECARESIKQRFRRIKYQYTVYPNHLTKANKHRNQCSLYACQSVPLGMRALCPRRRRATEGGRRAATAKCGTLHLILPPPIEAAGPTSSRSRFELLGNPSRKRGASDRGGR